MKTGRAAIFLIILFLCQCRKIDVDTIDNLNGGKIMIIGHGGAGFQTARSPIPSNSETSILKALEIYNADGVELDVQLSKDSVVMLFHNSYLESTSNCQGCISDYTAEELNNCEYRQDFAVNSLSNEKIITLEKVFQKYQNSAYNPVFFIDTKHYPECDSDYLKYINSLSKKLVELVEKYRLEKRVIIEGGEDTFLHKIRTLNAAIPVYLDLHDFDSGFRRVIENDFDGVVMGYNEISKEQIEQMHSKQKRVALFLVKDRPSTYKAVSKHPDMIQTDNIELLQEFLRE